MRKKWWLAIALLFVLAIGAAVVIPALLPPSPGVTYQNYNRIEKGMTRADVEEILGKPKIELRGLGFNEPPIDEGGAAGVLWTNADGDDVWIDFDVNGRVATLAWNNWPDGRNRFQKLMDSLPWIAKPAPPRMPIYVPVR